MPTIKTTIALLAFLLAPLAHAADVAPAEAPAPAKLCRTFHGAWQQTVDESGRIVVRRPSRTVCVGPVAAPGGAR